MCTFSVVIRHVEVCQLSHLQHRYQLCCCYFTSFEFFTLVLAGGLSSGSEWQQVYFVFISKSQRILYVSFSRTDSGLSMYHLCLDILIAWYYYFTSYEFFTPTETGVISLDSGRQQIFSCLQDSSKYFSRSQQLCSLDVLDSSSDI